MAEFQWDYDNMVEEADMSDFEDVEGPFDGHGLRGDAIDTDSDDDIDLKYLDTTAVQARHGKDIQGIPWERLHFTREKYRQTRLKQYKNYKNLNMPHDALDKECKPVRKDGKFFDFHYNTRSVKSTFVHFQLRNLVWATSKHDVYLISNYTVMYRCSLNRRRTEVLNVAEPLAPAPEVCKNPWAVQQGLGRVQISTMCVEGNLLVAGGFHGELIAKNLNGHGVLYCAKISHDENAITNAIEIYENASGAKQLMTSNNDSVVRMFDVETFVILRSNTFPWAVNHTSISPDRTLSVVVGDHAEGLLVDHQTGKVVSSLRGHLDYSFASAWHPDGRYFALLIAGHFLPFGRQDFSSCKYLARAFLQGDTNPGAYSVEIRTTELKNMSNAIQNASIPMNSTSIGAELIHVKEDPNKRAFRPYGNAAYLFIQMGAYRGGPDTFAVVGLASKPLHVYGKPRFECEWIPKNSSSGSLIKGKAEKMLPDWGYGRVYTVVVINCTFSQSVGTDANGGKLILHAIHGDEFGKPERIVALKEEQGTYNGSVYSQAPPYDYLYCGSSLYGDLSPQRMREWMAYHAKFFGPRSHFILHDAGGVHPQVRKVLEPWIRAGRVTLQDITEQEQFDGYYHNQFLIVNDCLHRYKFMAKWTFFFDVDEYLYIPGRKTLQYVLKELSGYTQFTIEQYSMSNKLCLQNRLHSISANSPYSREWGFEKLLFRDVKRGIRRDRKYAVQARNVYATGVHMSENVIGKTQHKTEGKIRYYHYHNTITTREEPCRQFVRQSMRNNVTWVGGTPYVYDATMKALAPSIKKFESELMGSELASIQQ